MKAIKNIWKIICYPLLYLGVQFVVSVIYAIIYFFGVGIKIGIERAMSGEIIDINDANKLTESIIMDMNIMLSVIISVVVTVIIIFFIFRKEWIKEKFWGFGKLKISPMVLCLFFGAAANILTICILAIFGVADEPSVLDDLIGSNIILDFLAIALLGPILEEIIFRGIVLKRLNKMTGRNVAIILQALIFGFIHLNFLQGIYAFFLAVFIGYIYLWFDSVWYAIIVHVAYNGTNLFLMYALGDSEVDLFYFLIISAAVFIISMACMVALADRKEKEDAKT